MSTRVRITAVVLDILDVLANAAPDHPAWGLRLCEQTGHGSGTIYPALDRLMKVGWIEDHWEQEEPKDRPKRRYYTITAAGRAAYMNAITARQRRRAAWLPADTRIEVAR
jgi:PadR family transcriptional regulator PadR